MKKSDAQELWMPLLLLPRKVWDVPSLRQGSRIKLAKLLQELVWFFQDPCMNNRTDSQYIRSRVPRNKKLLGAKGITTRSKDATRGSWPYYERSKKLLGNVFKRVQRTKSQPTDRS